MAKRTHKLEVTTALAPDHYASYFVNGDESIFVLDPNERHEADMILDSWRLDGWYVVSTDDRLTVSCGHEVYVLHRMVFTRHGRKMHRKRMQRPWNYHAAARVAEGFAGLDYARANRMLAAQCRLAPKSYHRYMRDAWHEVYRASHKPKPRLP